MKISIIVPIYNVEEYITQCINSIVKQTYQNIELILVDDGSSDKSGELCDAFAKSDNRIRVIHKENKGVSDSRNEGIKAATGEYIMFVDGDDFITCNAVSDIVEIINSNPNLDIIVGKAIEYYQEDEQYPESFIFDKSKIEGESGINVLTYFFNEIPIPMWSIWRVVIKKRILTDNNILFPVDVISAEDLDFIIAVYKNVNQVLVYDEPFYFYRKVRIGSVMNTISIKKCLDELYVIEKNAKEIIANDYSKIFTRAFFDWMSKIILNQIIVIYKIKNEEKKILINRLDDLIYILSLTNNKKNKFVCLLIKIIGYHYTSILYKFLKKVKRILRLRNA